MAKVWATKLKKTILWKRKLKAREVSRLSEGHTAGKPWSQEWDFSPPDSQAIALQQRILSHQTHKSSGCNYV